jgi:hypothetical protein
MADDPIPSPAFNKDTNAAIIKAGRNPSSLSAVYEGTVHKTGDVDAAAQAEFESVFGVGAMRDAKGRPIEIGKGSPAQATEQHKSALQKAEGRG